MKYFVKIRSTEAPEDEARKVITKGIGFTTVGTLCVDIYRIEWFGLKRTLISKGSSASRLDYEQIIRHDILEQSGFEYEVESREGNLRNTFEVHA